MVISFYSDVLLCADALAGVITPVGFVGFFPFLIEYLSGLEQKYRNTKKYFKILQWCIDDCFERQSLMLTFIHHTGSM